MDEKVKICLDLSNDLIVNDRGKLTLNISSSDGNTLEIKNDGLYAKASKGTDGSTGKGYEGRKLGTYLRLGYKDCGYPLEIEPRKVVCSTAVHRIFGAEINTDGSVSLNDFREVDTVLVGDFFAISKGNYGYTYYIITETSSERTNNSVTKFEKLGDVTL